MNEKWKKRRGEAKESDEWLKRMGFKKLVLRNM
jgi:hypothetical protein